MIRSISPVLLACLLGACFLDPVVGGECAPGFQECGDECIDVRADVANCGGCGVACTEGAECVAGLCLGGGCQPPEVWCDGAACADIQTDPANCGFCGNACEDGERCTGGTCVGHECPPGTLDCNGACIDPELDPRHCGGCGQACEDETFCVAGDCAAACPDDLTACGQMCVSTSTDPRHCGGCGIECGALEVCSDGQCEACPGGEVRCGKECVDTNSDADHCGECTTTCDALDTCEDASCVLHCPDDRLDCRTGRCIDAAVDPDHCGGCGISCDDDESCLSGICVDECGEGLSACQRQCVDTTNDPDHCGGCGQLCDTGICEGGQCRDGEIGHLVLIGHDYVRTRRDQSRLVANAALIPQGTVRVLTYGQYADASAVVNVNDIIIARAGESGRTISFVALDDAQRLDTALLEADVLLLFAQTAAEVDTLVALGELWTDALVSFLARGGVIVALDQATAPEGGSTHHILVAAGLLAVDGAVDVSGDELRVTGAGDIVASGMSASYRAEESSTAFTTNQGNAVVTIDGAVVVLHEVFLP